MRLALAVALGLGLSPGLGAAPAAADPPAPAALPLPERARAVLETYCVVCAPHAEEGRLDLDALADDPRLVVRRRPDASRVYQRLLGEAKATPDEIEAVRDWIESLSARDAPCHLRKIFTPRDVDKLIDLAVQMTASPERSGTRFVSLAHLWNGCVPDAELEEARHATAVLLAALARRREPLDLEAVGEERILFAVRLSKIALVPAEWNRLTAHAPSAASMDAAPADWLAAEVLSRPKNEAGVPDPAFDVAFDAAGLRAVERLAASWTRDVDLVRAAGERGMTHRAMAGTLSGIGGEFLHPARRLMQGALSRAAWGALSPALDGEAPVGSARTSEAGSGDEIEVLLWADKASYRPRDLVTVYVSASVACHLTLIDVDQAGKAIVLFPNDLEQDNLITPGVDVMIPGRDAAYQLRFDRAGEEQIVAICQRDARRPQGISYDYEKQRFAVLGDWRTFLRTATEREAKIRAAGSGEGSRRRRRASRGTSPPPPPIEPASPMSEGRAAITITIDPGSAPELRN
ncbi:MAG: DUF4384 domain-containing protein [Hyphomicrobium sp.]|uniref:DUF4384 domain-containing protein n=1 Tax=Hyphomicrobium sp. TaxID=82 RepID=UPI003D0B1278